MARTPRPAPPAPGVPDTRRGRHRSRPAGGSGRPRSPRRRRTVAAVVGAAAVAGIAVASMAGASDQARVTCPDGRHRLTVAAAPEIAAPVAATAAEVLWDDAGAGACVDVRVSVAQPADVAAALDGPDGGERPDVWIPDSSLWTSTLPGTDAPSVARSPLVLAVPQAVATGLGWPATAVDPTAVLGGPLRLALADPARSAVARAGLLAVDRALAPLPDGRRRLGAVFLAAQRGAPEDPDAALGAMTGDLPLATFVPEQAVWAANARVPGSPLVALYPGTPTALDYPFVVLTDRPGVRAEAERFARVLAGPDGTRRLYDAGFRAPDGTPGAVLRTEDGVSPRAAGGTPPDPREVARAQAAFEAVTLGTRMLAVIDVSGSMVLPMPGEPPRTRIELAVGAATNGVALYPDDAEVGLWVFSTGLTATTDHRELVPVGPLGLQPDGVRGRERMAAALGGITLAPDGDTALYDTTLAAVRSVRAGWQPGRVNSVVLFTDGRNDDGRGIGLEQLLATLQAEAGDRPVPVISLALGDGADFGALREIARVTHGATYEVRDVRQIREVLADALSSRPCRPAC